MPLNENGSWVPILLTDLNTQDNVSWQAYLNFMWKCDKFANVKDPAMSMKHYIMLPVYIFTLLVGIAAMLPTWRFSKRKDASGYMILLHTGITELYMQLRFYIILYAEFYFSTVIRLPYPYGMFDSFILQMGLARDWLIVVLAINRSIAVLYPVYYKKIFKRKRTKLFIVFGYLMMANEALIMDWHPWYWKFDCVYLKAKNELPLGDFAGVIPDRLTELFMIYFYPVKGYIHLCIYAFTVVILAKRHVFAKLKGDDVMLEESDNQSKMRMRLFVICVIMVLPNFATVCLFQIVTRFYPWDQMDQATSNFISIFLYTPLNISTYAGQPFILMALSSEFRRAMFKYLIIWKAILLRLNPFNSSYPSEINVIRVNPSTNIRIVSEMAS